MRFCLVRPSGLLAFPLFVCLAMSLISVPNASAQLPTETEPIAVLPESDESETDQPLAPTRFEEMESPVIKAVIEAFGEPKGATRLLPDARLWIDRAKRRVIIDGYVAIREGPLEMFACPSGTKEHESAVGLLAMSRYVHAALLAVEATPGRPVQFHPKFRPPSGDRIAVWILWRDKAGKRHRAKAQEWICKTGTKEHLTDDFVFAGSQWWTDERNGQEHYSADDGDLICVSNFQSATLDIPIESSKDNEYLEFSACSDNIPPRFTPVRVVLVPISPALNAKKPEPGEANEPPSSDNNKSDKAVSELDELNEKPPAKKSVENEPTATESPADGDDS